MSNGRGDSDADDSTENQKPHNGNQQESSSPTNDTSSPFTNVWQRWRRGTDIPFHQYSDFFPQSEGDPPSDQMWIYYIPKGKVRDVLRYTPGIILIAVILFAIMEITAGHSGLIQYLYEMWIENQRHVLIGIGWLILLLILLREAKLLPPKETLQSFIIYSMFLILLGDVVYTFIQVTNANFDTSGEVAFLPGSWYLLSMLIGGLLVYDGMLRTENMFSRLHEKDPSMIGPPVPKGESKDYVYKSNFLVEFKELLASMIGPPDPKDKFDAFEQAYKSNFLTEFKELLEHMQTRELRSREISIPTAYLFSLVFVLPFFGLRFPDVTLSVASFIINISDIIVAVVLSFFSFILLIVFFQFLVLIKYFNRLLTEHSPYGDNTDVDFTLQYQPDHPDGYAGFRDLGQFAIRVNIILFLGGISTAYWLYAFGLPNLPEALSDVSMMWAFRYLGPLLVYVFTVLIWIYFSFWQIHKTMRKGRERRIEMEISDNDGELPDEKRDLKKAPIWPLNVRIFASILAGDMLPLLSLIPLGQL